MSEGSKYLEAFCYSNVYAGATEYFFFITCVLFFTPYLYRPIFALACAVVIGGVLQLVHLNSFVNGVVLFCLVLSILG